jgi:hypothetical protein
VRTVPRWSLATSTAFGWAVLRGKDRADVLRLLHGAKGAMPLLEPRVSCPPTGRADVAQVLRSLYLRDLDLAPGNDITRGRRETALADQGLFLALRPFGRTTSGKVDLDVSLRAAWIKETRAEKRDTALGTVPSLAPEIGTWWGDLSVALGDEEALVFVAMRSPFPAAPDGRDRLAIVVTNAGP